jgi:hypothetical protein
MLLGRFASQKSESLFPSLWDGCVGAWCPSVQGPSGLRLLDLSGRRNDGTLTNMDAPTDWVRSGGRYALDFTSAGRDNVNFGNVCFLPNDMSVACWVNKFASSATFSNFWAVCRWNTGGSPGSNEYVLGLANNASGNGNNPSFGIEIGTTSHSVNSSAALSLSAWSHVCGVRSGSNLLIYINGLLTGTATGIPTTAITNRSRSLRLCDSDLASDLGNNQQLDDIRIYNRALRPIEIETLASRRGIAFEPKRRRLVVRGVTLGVSSQYRRRFGKFATDKTNAKFPSLWDGLVGAWCPSASGPSSNRLYDLSGRSNHGTLTNMDAATDWVRSGAGGYALDFDGTNDAVETGRALTVSTAVTAACWVFVRAYPTVSPFLAGFFNADTGNTGFSIRLNYQANAATNNVPSFVAFIGGAYRQAFGSTVPLNQWTHLAGVYTGSAMSLFVNGALAGSSSISGTIAAGGTLVLANDFRQSANRFLNGQLDDILIYNRALSRSEIRILASRRGAAHVPVRRMQFRATAIDSPLAGSLSLQALASSINRPLASYTFNQTCNELLTTPVSSIT